MLCQALVELYVVVFVEVVFVSKPDCFVCVHLFPFQFSLFDFLFRFVFFLRDFDIIFGLFFLFGWGIDLNLALLLQVDREIDEL